MFDVYEALKSGMTSEELVDSFTKSLNEAQSRLAEEEAAQVEKAKAAEKREDVARAVTQLYSAIGTHYPELGFGDQDDEFYDTVACTIINTLDEAAARLRCPKQKDDVFAKFFDLFGL